MNNVSPNLVVRPVIASDQRRWAELYAGYRGFYGLGADASLVARTWEWVLDGQHGLTGLVAVSTADDELVGLANLRTFARPSSGTIGLYLDDLFTDPAARRRGVGAALLDAAAELAAHRGASVVRWITAGDNATARSLYDQHAVATPWVTYDMPPKALG